MSWASPRSPSSGGGGWPRDGCIARSCRDNDVKTGHWDRIRALFDEACELGPAERRDFLADACGDDDHLRVEIESILAASE